MHQDHLSFILLFGRACLDGFLPILILIFFFFAFTVKTKSSFLHRVRVTTDETYTRKKTWPLQALASIDNVSQDSRQFILTFDKSYEWIAPNVTEKQRFLEAIVKVGHYSESTRGCGEGRDAVYACVCVKGGGWGNRHRQT